MSRDELVAAARCQVELLQQRKMDQPDIYSNYMWNKLNNDRAELKSLDVQYRWLYIVFKMVRFTVLLEETEASDHTHHLVVSFWRAVSTFCCLMCGTCCGGEVSFVVSCQAGLLPGCYAGVTSYTLRLVYSFVSSLGNSVTLVRSVITCLITCLIGEKNISTIILFKCIVRGWWDKKIGFIPVFSCTVC